MDNIEILKSFVSGKITIEEFKEIYHSNKSLQDLLQDKLPQSMLINIDIKANSNNINEVLHKKSWNTKGGQCSIHGFIEMWLKGNHIDIIPTTIYDDEYKFLISIMPNYINGGKAETLIDEIVKSVPEDIGRTKRIKTIKEKIKEAFHLQDGKRPIWPQDTEWPFSKTVKPLKYISRRTDGDLVQLTFKDVDTGELVIVEDYY